MLLGLHIKTRQELGDLPRGLVAILAQRGRSFPKDWFGCRSLASSALCARLPWVRRALAAPFPLFRA